MDREYKLAVPPTIFADFTKMPIREGVVDLGIFDPPFHKRHGDKGVFYNPDRSKGSASNGYWSSWPHYGYYTSIKEMAVNIMGGFKEFHRVTDRVAFKWGEGTMTIKKVLTLATGWVPFYKYQRKSKGVNVGNTSSVHWTTLVKDGNTPLTQTRLGQ